jgi:hypothetical protein
LLFPCLAQRDEWPTTPVSGVLGKSNTRIFRGYPVGTYPHRGRLSLRYSWRDAALPKPMDWLPVASRIKIADILVNTVLFLRAALRRATRTRFSFQGTIDTFLHRGAKVEMARVQTRRETRLTAGVGNLAACGGSSVISQTHSFEVFNNMCPPCGRAPC